MTDHLHPEPVARAAHADGALHREQAGLFSLTASEVRSQLAGSRWTRWGDHVVLLHNGPPTRRQLMWMALLDAGWPAALVAHTSLELAGFRSFVAEQEQIHLVIPRGARTTSYPWLRVHESRRVCPAEHVLIDGMPTTAVAQSAIDAGRRISNVSGASWSAEPGCCAPRTWSSG